MNTEIAALQQTKGAAVDFLQKVIAMAPSVASSPPALALYALAVIAWAVLAWRSQRLKILLARLQALPAEDRRKMIEAELGHIPVPDGMTVPQWLRAQRMRYRFLGLLVALLTVAAVGVIAAFLSREAPAVPASSAAPAERTPAAQAKEKALVEAYGQLSHLKIGSTRAFLEAKFGPPQLANTYSEYDTATYMQSEYWLRLYFEPEGERLTGYLLYARSGSYKPPIPWYRAGDAPSLGDASFAALAPDEEIRIWGAINGGTLSGTSYVEVIDGPSNATTDNVVLVGNFSGRDESTRPDEDRPASITGGFLELSMTDYEHLPASLKPYWSFLRSRWLPNAFGEFRKLPPLDELPFTVNGGAPAA